MVLRGELRKYAKKFWKALNLTAASMPVMKIKANTVNTCLFCRMLNLMKDGLSFTIIGSSVARVFRGGRLAHQESLSEEEIEKILRKSMKTWSKFEEEWGKWNFFPPWMVRLAMAAGPAYLLCITSKVKQRLKPSYDFFSAWIVQRCCKLVIRREHINSKQKIWIGRFSNFCLLP